MMMLRTLIIAALAFAGASSPAWAQSAAPSPLASLLPIVLIIAIFYLLIIRPQNKKFKEHRAMIAAIARGDRVITGGGIHGKVTKVEEGGSLRVEIAEGVEVTVEQSTVSQVKAKTGAASPAAEPAKKETKPAAKSAKAKKAANDNG
jgi:preprotein translocase subunit YajC